VQGETGTSLIALSAFAPDTRRALNYWVALALMTALVAASCSSCCAADVGASIQAIRDNEEAAASLGVRVMATKRLIFVLAAVGAPPRER
jgi:branched-chain amino acid transport system permease protein